MSKPPEVSPQKLPAMREWLTKEIETSESEDAALVEQLRQGVRGIHEYSEILNRRAQLEFRLDSLQRAWDSIARKRLGMLQDCVDYIRQLDAGEMTTTREFTIKLDI